MTSIAKKVYKLIKYIGFKKDKTETERKVSYSYKDDDTYLYLMYLNIDNVNGYFYISLYNKSGRIQNDNIEDFLKTIKKFYPEKYKKYISEQRKSFIKKLLK